MSIKVNDRPYELVGFTHNDYLRWCKLTNKAHREKSTKKEFFKLVNTYKITHDTKGNCIFDGKEF